MVGTREFGIEVGPDETIDLIVGKDVGPFNLNEGEEVGDLTKVGPNEGRYDGYDEGHDEGENVVVKGADEGENVAAKLTDVGAFVKEVGATVLILVNTLFINKKESSMKKVIIFCVFTISCFINITIAPLQS